MYARTRHSCSRGRAAPVARLMLYGARRAIPKAPCDARSHHPAAHPSRNSDRISDEVTLARDPIDLVADDEDGQEGEYSSDDAGELDHALSVGRLLGGYKELDESLVPPPVMLAHEHATELGEPVGRVVERAKDPLAILDRHGEDHRLQLERLVEQARGGFVDQRGELSDEFVRNPDAGEHHDPERTYVRVRMEDANTEERSRVGPAELRSPLPLSPEEEIRDRPGARIADRAER
jgi:hypothetical protein